MLAKIQSEAFHLPFNEPQAEETYEQDFTVLFEKVSEQACMLDFHEIIYYITQVNDSECAILPGIQIIHQTLWSY